MHGAVLLTRAPVDVAFHCLGGRGREATHFGQDVALATLCRNTRTWFAKAEWVEEDRVRVERGGICPDCGHMGQAALQDTVHALAPGGVVTVEVAG